MTKFRLQIIVCLEEQWHTIVQSEQCILVKLNIEVNELFE